MISLFLRRTSPLHTFCGRPHLFHRGNSSAATVFGSSPALRRFTNVEDLALTGPSLKAQEQRAPYWFSLSTTVSATVSEITRWKVCDGIFKAVGRIRGRGCICSPCGHASIVRLAELQSWGACTAPQRSLASGICDRIQLWDSQQDRVMVKVQNPRSFSTM